MESDYGREGKGARYNRIPSDDTDSILDMGTHQNCFRNSQEMRSFAFHLQVRVNSDELAMKVDEDVRAFHAEVERSTRGRNNGVIQTQVRMGLMRKWN